MKLRLYEDDEETCVFDFNNAINRKLRNTTLVLKNSHEELKN